ncbi:unnamed protein product [Spirodela intermedia]|uniref:C3H1-type domain-containing protein n=1 Tax=Spirodela intermedia TaxID=51605 RepID=A0A7I8K8Z4_SPIIN|nr:unnamed protein product [Spirodela intermedia]
MAVAGVHPPRSPIHDRRLPCCGTASRTAGVASRESVCGFWLQGRCARLPCPFLHCRDLQLLVAGEERVACGGKRGDLTACPRLCPKIIYFYFFRRSAGVVPPSIKNGFLFLLCNACPSHGREPGGASAERLRGQTETHGRETGVATPEHRRGSGGPSETKKRKTEDSEELSLPASRKSCNFQYNSVLSLIHILLLCSQSFVSLVSFCFPYNLSKIWA